MYLTNGLRALARICVIWNIIAYVAIAQAPTKELSSTRNARFVLTSCWGHPVLAASIKLVSNAGLPTKYLSYPKEDTVAVEPGDYAAVIEARGFLSATKAIRIESRNIIVPLCLLVAPIESSDDEKAPSLEGTVAMRLLIAGPKWVRLVAAYDSFSAIEQVSEDGGFSFVRLRPGRYFIMLFCAGELKRSQFVDIRAFQKNSLRIE